MATSFLVASAILLVCSAQNANNTTPTMNIPLRMMREAGFIQDNNAMLSKREMVDKYVVEIRRFGGTFAPILRPDNGTSGPKMTIHGQIDGQDYANSGDGANVLAGKVLSQAGCEPYDQVLNLPVPASNIFLYPSCVTVKQCGGCCGHPSLTCRPSRTSTIFVEVMKFTYSNSATMAPSSMVDTVAIDVHTACECGCKVQESDCDPLIHDYDDWDCKCVCKSEARKTSCPSNMRWNSDLCRCQCADLPSCGSGFRFNVNTCSCDSIVANNGVVAATPETPVAQPDVRPDSAERDCSHMNCRRGFKLKISFTGTCDCVYVGRRRG